MPASVYQFLILLLTFTAGLLPTAGLAEVTVVANRTPRRVPIEVKLPGGKPWSVTLSVGESRPIFADGTAEVALHTGREVMRYSLEPGAVYFIGARPDGTVDLEQIGLGDPAPLVAPLPGTAEGTPPVTIPVKVLVDDEETTRQALWEVRLRKRVEAASQILHRHAMVKLQVVAADTWVTDNQVHDFNATLRQFEQTVDPFPGELAIGFSSQYQVVRGRVHMGGTRGPLRPHILLREWSRHATETEKLELLVHELGHYLGATHSPEPDSVMRPVLSDRQARRAGFVVKFDPVNTLLISMVGEELRRRRVSSFDQISPATKTRMQDIYQVVGQAQPNDPAARLLSGQLGRQASTDPLTVATRRALGQLTQAARTNSRRPLADSARPGPYRVEGDELLSALVRLLAREAAKAPEELQAKVFLLALGIGIGDPEDLKKLPAFAAKLRRMETPAERSIRNTYVGQPTVQGRHDLARHFTVAAMLVAAADRDTAETLSMAKEVVDAQQGSGFSFADLAADKAGIALAERLLAGKISLEELADRFRAADYVPDVSGLPESISTLQFMEQYGGQHDERFQRVMAEIDERINALPAYSSP